MKSLITHSVAAICAILIFSKCTHPSPFEYKTLNQPAGCFIDSVVFTSCYKASQRLDYAGCWSEIVCLTWYDAKYQKHGHAFVIFKYRDLFYAYDPASGSFQLLSTPLDEREAVRAIAPDDAYNLSIDTIIPGQ